MVTIGSNVRKLSFPVRRCHTYTKAHFFHHRKISRTSNVWSLRSFRRNFPPTFPCNASKKFEQLGNEYERSGSCERREVSRFLTSRKFYRKYASPTHGHFLNYVIMPNRKRYIAVRIITTVENLLIADMAFFISLFFYNLLRYSVSYICELISSYLYISLH